MLVRRRTLIGLLAVLPVLAVVGWTAIEYWPHDPPPPLPAPRDPVLPDLAMAPLADMLGAVTEGEETPRQQIFFSASIANRGPGPFIINAVRGDEHGQWRVSQRFLDTGGDLTEVATPADMTWGGHGHNHWHVRIGAAYSLESVPGGKEVRSLEKVGYCFFDQQPYDRAAMGAFPAAGVLEERVQREVHAHARHGPVARLADPYSWALPDQRLDITGLPDGRYRLVATADPNNWFREVDETNNTAWALMELTTSTSPPVVNVVAQGQAPRKG